VSLYPLDRPSFRIVAKLDDRLDPKPLIEIMLGITSGISTLGKKGFLTKERKSRLKIHRDKEAEKAKQKRYKV
jgi:hypothetical protein